MSRLIDKLNTYTLEYLFNFNESSLVLPPTESTGHTVGNPTFWSYIGNTNGNLSALSDGVMPGQGSYKFLSNATGGSRIRHGSSTTNQTWHDKFRDQDFSVGFWVKFNSFATSDIIVSQVTNSISGPSPVFMGYRVGAYDNAGTKTITFDIGVDYISVTTDHLGNPITTGKWYYIAIRKFKPDSTTVNGEVYLNGVLKYTNTYAYQDFSIGFLSWGWNVAGYDSDYQISSWYLATSSDINATAIGDIWDYGSPIQTTIKYYDGDSWENSIGSKVYHSGGWNDIYASRWDGTQWLPL